jgi:hypothetical protein
MGRSVKKRKKHKDDELSVKPTFRFNGLLQKLNNIASDKARKLT